MLLLVLGERLLFHRRKIRARRSSRPVRSLTTATGNLSRPSVCKPNWRRATPSSSISPPPGASPANSTKRTVLESAAVREAFRAPRRRQIEGRLDERRSRDHKIIATIWPAGCPIIRALPGQNRGTDCVSGIAHQEYHPGKTRNHHAHVASQ